jgi:hypothetical protein
MPVPYWYPYFFHAFGQALHAMVQDRPAGHEQVGLGLRLARYLGASTDLRYARQHSFHSVPYESSRNSNVRHLEFEGRTNGRSNFPPFWPLEPSRARDTYTPLLQELNHAVDLIGVFSVRKSDDLIAEISKSRRCRWKEDIACFDHRRSAVRVKLFTLTVKAQYMLHTLSTQLLK